MARSEARRRAILDATMQVVGEKGYRAASVTGVVAAAGASRATFYKNFADKHECFLAAYEATVERIVAEVATVCEADSPWIERARAGLERLAELLAADPALARAVVVEVAAAGAEAQRRRWLAIERFARLLEGDGEPDHPDLPPNTGVMAVGAVSGLLFDQLQTGRAAELPRLAAELLFALLVPYLGPAAAAEEAGWVAVSSR